MTGTSTSKPVTTADDPAQAPVWLPGDRFRLWFGIGGIALGAGYLVLALQLGVGVGDRPGAGFFPFVAGLVLIVFLMIDLVRLMVRRSSWTRGQWELSREASMVLVVIAAYLVLANLLGHLLTSALCAAMLLLSLGSRSRAQVLWISLLIGAGSDLLFTALLGLRLPEGLLGIGWSQWM